MFIWAWCNTCTLWYSNNNENMCIIFLTWEIKQFLNSLTPIAWPKHSTPSGVSSSPAAFSVEHLIAFPTVQLFLVLILSLIVLEFCFFLFSQCKSMLQWQLSRTCIVPFLSDVYGSCICLRGVHFPRWCKFMLTMPLSKVLAPAKISKDAGLSFQINSISG